MEELIIEYSMERIMQVKNQLPQYFKIERNTPNILFKARTSDSKGEASTVQGSQSGKKEVDELVEQILNVDFLNEVRECFSGKQPFEDFKEPTSSILKKFNDPKVAGKVADKLKDYSDCLSKFVSLLKGNSETRVIKLEE